METGKDLPMLTPFSRTGAWCGAIPNKAAIWLTSFTLLAPQ
jgi:hypothetical protein